MNLGAFNHPTACTTHRGAETHRRWLACCSRLSCSTPPPRARRIASPSPCPSRWTARPPMHHPAAGLLSRTCLPQRMVRESEDDASCLNIMNNSLVPVRGSGSFGHRGCTVSSLTTTSGTPTNMSSTAATRAASRDAGDVPARALAPRSHVSERFGSKSASSMQGVPCRLTFETSGLKALYFQGVETQTPSTRGQARVKRATPHLERRRVHRRGAAAPSLALR